MAVQRVVLCGLLCVNIQTCCADLTGLECGKQRVLVDIGSAGGVDDHNAVFHLGDAVCVNQSAAVDCRSVDRDEVGLFQQLVHFHVRNAKLLFDAGDVEDIKSDDVMPIAFAMTPRC